MAETQSPTIKLYIRVALLLGVLTAIEVGLFYLVEFTGMTQAMATPLLLGLAASKFLIVVGYFMHLKYEKPLLSRTFAIGAVLAGGLYAVVIADTIVSYLNNA
jgi:cytochrome c oxidase subunit 4